MDKEFEAWFIAHDEYDYRSALAGWNARHITTLRAEIDPTRVRFADDGAVSIGPFMEVKDGD